MICKHPWPSWRTKHAARNAQKWIMTGETDIKRHDMPWFSLYLVVIDYVWFSAYVSLPKVVFSHFLWSLAPGQITTNLWTKIINHHCVSIQEEPLNHCSKLQTLWGLGSYSYFLITFSNSWKILDSFINSFLTISQIEIVFVETQ